MEGAADEESPMVMKTPQNVFEGKRRVELPGQEGATALGKGEPAWKKTVEMQLQTASPLG